MAREYAALKMSIWRDPDWKNLPARLQHAYLTFLSQPRITPCGVLDFIPARLAGLARGQTVEDVEKAVTELQHSQSKPWVIHDEETGELLLRTFVRHDGLIRSEKSAKAIAKDYFTITSDPIRQAVLVELRRHRKDNPNLNGWVGIKQESPHLMGLLDTPGSPSLKAVSQ